MRPDAGAARPRPKPTVMTTLELYRSVLARLEAAAIPEAEFDATILLGEVLALTRSGLFLAAGEEVAAGARARVEELLVRRLRREPLAYLLGEQEFWSLSFRVTPAVLIPRPETELLVEKALALCRTPDAPPAPRILELGAGSGVIAIVLALELPAARLFSLDCSLAALRVARENSERHGVRSRLALIQSDLLSAIRPAAQFDLLIGNPPYVDPLALATLQPEVRDYEPHLALDGGAGGVEIYRRLAAGAGACLKAGGWLLLEIGAEQGEYLQALFAQQGDWEGVAVFPDYAGLPRILQARKKGQGQDSRPARAHNVSLSLSL